MIRRTQHRKGGRMPRRRGFDSGLIGLETMFALGIPVGLAALWGITAALIITLIAAVSIFSFVALRRGRGPADTGRFEMPSIMLFVPHTVADLKSEEAEKIKAAIIKANESLSEEVHVKFFADYGSEKQNAEYARRFTKSLGAKLGVPVRRDITADELIKEIEAGFLHKVAMDLFEILNPELAKLDSTRTELISRKDLINVEKVVSRVINRATSHDLTTQSAYALNIRMSNTTKRIMDLDRLTRKAADTIRGEEPDEYLVNKTVRTLGEAKQVAEAHRNTMASCGFYEKSRYPVRLRIRVVLKDKDDVANINGNAKEILENMGIDDVIDSEDICAVDYETAKGETAKDIYKQIEETYGDKFAKKNIAIVGYKAEERKSEDIPEGVLFIEYAGTANARVYELVLEVLTRDANDPELVKLGIKKSDKAGSALWLVLPEMKEIDTDALKREFMMYHKVLIKA
jgi:flavodoxin